MSEPFTPPPLLFFGAYDAEGNIGMVVGSTIAEEATQSLVDAGFTTIVAVPGARAALSHRVDMATGQVVARDADPAADLATLRDRMTVTRKQMMQALASEPWNFITRPEALASLATGAVPATLATLLAGMDDDAAFDVQMTWVSFAEAHRTDPLVAALAAHVGMTDDQIDAFFEFAALL